MEIIRSLFSEVYTLDDWIRSIDINKDLHNRLIIPEDSRGFVQFMRSTLIALSQNAKKLPLPVSSFKQMSYQREVIIRVIERIRRREGTGKNILTFGFGPMSDNPDAQISSTPNIEYRYPNSIINRLHYGVWNKLLTRIGDTVMEYLLEYTFIFMFVPPSCYVQITGKPTYELWPYQSGINPAIRSISKYHKGKLIKKFGKYHNTKKKKCTNNKTKTGLQQKFTILKRKHFVDHQQTTKHLHDQVEGLGIQSCDKIEQSVKHVCNQVEGSAKHPCDPDEHSTKLPIDQDELPKNFPYDQDKQSSSFIPNELNNYQVQKDKNPLNYEQSGRPLKRKLVEEGDTLSPKNKRLRDVLNTSDETVIRIEDEKLTYYSSGATETQDKNVDQERLSYQLVDHRMAVTMDKQAVVKGGQAVVMDNQAVALGGQAVALDNQSVTLGDQAVVMDNQAVTLGDQAVVMDNKAVAFGGQAVVMDNKAVAFGGQAVAMDNQAAVKDDQAIAMDNQANQYLAIGNQAVPMRNQGDAMDVQVIAIDTDSRKQSHTFTSEMCIESEKDIFQINDGYKEGLQKGTSKKWRKCKKKSKIQDFTPFVFHTYFARISMLYSKVLSERLPKNFKRTDPRELYTEMFCSEDICGSLKTKIHMKAENCSSISDKYTASEICQQPMNESDTFKEPVLHNHKPISDNIKHTEESSQVASQQPIGKSVTYEESAQELINAALLTYEKPVHQPINTDLTQNIVTGNGQFCDRADFILLDNNHQAQTSKHGNIQEDGTCDLSRPLEPSNVGTAGPILTDLESEITSSVQIDFIPELIPILDSFITKCRKCPFQALLNRHCNSRGDIHKKAAADRQYSTIQTERVAKLKGSRHIIPIFRRRGLTGDRLGHRSATVHGSLVSSRNKPPSVRHLLSEFIPHRQVYLFLRLVCLLVVPEELWGPQHNRNIFLKNVGKIICMGKYDKFCLGQLMHGVKTKGVGWLKNIKSNCSKIHMIAKVWYWLMKHFVMVILKSFFYITETTQHRNRLFYYRKKTWNILHSSGLSELKQKHMLKPLSQEETKVFSVKTLGVASLRFLPKKKSLRPIINLGQQPSQSLKQTLPINKQLLNLHHVITFIKNEWPHLLGSAKFGTNEIFMSWKPFKLKWEMNGRKRLYFVKTDVINCFDNIRQEKLYNIIEEILKQFGCEEFVVRKFTSIYQAIGNLKRTFHRKVHKMIDYNPDFFLYMKDASSEEKYRNAIMVDQVVNQHERTDNLLQQLKSHLFYNIIKIGKQYYHQSRGISQGSILSTLLCNLYYGHMEKQMFSFRDDELLLRVVDDFLFVTPNKDSAVEFLNKIAAGNKEYNCYVNADKILINFHYIHDKFGEIPSINETDWFPWCGMLFNTSSLNVSIDFSRYSGICVADTISYDLANKPGQSMRKKLLFSLRPKCHSMFLDSELNQEDVIITNCYKLFLLTAFKFHVYAAKFPHKQRAENNPGFFLDMIMDLANFLHSQTKISRTNKGYKYFQEKIRYIYIYINIRRKRAHTFEFNSKDFYVKETKEKGRGIFTNRFFNSPVPLLPYEGKLLEYEPEGDDTYVFELGYKGKTYWIDASEEDNSYGRLLNDDHLKPNCRPKVVDVNGKPHVWFFSLRDLEKDTELLYNYGSGSEFPWRCKVTMAIVLDKDTLQWLCIRAFIVKLQKHHSQYNGLLKLLKTIKSRLERKLQSKDVELCDKLEELCNGLPSDFEDILS